MAKRFIDTSLFDDSWFMSLSKDGKIFWLYLITKCDHAGIIELNEILAKVQTGLKSLLTVTKELDNRLIKLRDNYYFIPKFIDFQYPKFPQSNVRQQESAIKRLCEFGLFDKENNKINLSLNKELANPYDNDTVIVNEYVYNKFYDFELFENGEIKKDLPQFYENYVKFLFGDNELQKKLTGVLSIRDQLKAIDFDKLVKKARANDVSIKDITLKIENNKKYYKDKNTVYYTINNWINNNEKYS